MDPFTASLALRGGMAVGQLAAGYLLKPKERPKYRIPGGITETANRARIQANASDDAILQNDEANIDQSSANAVKNVQRTATSGSDAVLSAGSIQGQIDASKMQANRSFAQRKMINENRLGGALAQEAQYQDKAWDYNVNQPYQEAMDTSNAMFSAGMGNLTDAIDMNTNMAMIDQYNPQGVQGGNGSTQGRSSLSSGMRSIMNKRFMDSMARPKFYQM